MFASAAWVRRSRRRAGVTRCKKQSSGIQLAPRQKIGLPLTLSVKAAPVSSGVVSSSVVRTPIRPSHVAPANVSVKV